MRHYSTLLELDVEGGSKLVGHEIVQTPFSVAEVTEPPSERNAEVLGNLKISARVQGIVVGVVRGDIDARRALFPSHRGVQNESVGQGHLPISEGKPPGGRQD